MRAEREIRRPRPLAALHGGITPLIAELAAAGVASPNLARKRDFIAAVILGEGRAAVVAE
jgi:hypothetical protein